MTASLTPMEALRRLIEACKLIDFADCKDETVWQALVSAQGVAEGVVRDYVPESFQKPDGTCKRWCGDGECKEACVSPSAPAADPTAAVSAAPSGEVERDAKLWCTFTRVLRTGRLPGPAHGRRFKIIEICPMSGDAEEINDFIGAIEALATKE